MLKGEITATGLLAIIVSAAGLGLAISGTILFTWEEKEPLDPYGYTYRIVFPYQHLGTLMWLLALFCFISVFLIWLVDRLMGSSTAKQVDCTR